MNPLRAYQEQQGRTNEEMATDLSALLGRKIGVSAYKMHSGKAKAPKAWADALGIEPLGEAEPPWDGLAADPGETPVEREPSASPKMPEGAKVTTPSVAGDYGFAKQRLVQAYEAIGAGASMITHNEGYGAVTSSYAPHLSQAWIDAAKTNENVAKIVRFMESGGPVGELVVGHIILVLGFVYVSGKGPDLDAIYGKKFAGYRAAAIGGHIAAETERVAASNGSNAESAAHTVGDAAV